MTDNEIGDEGAKSLGEMLQVNTTLTSLDLGSEEEEGKERKIKNEMMIEQQTMGLEVKEQNH